MYDFQKPDNERQKIAVKFEKQQYLFTLVELVIAIVALSALLATRFTFAISKFLSMNPVLSGAVYAVILGVLFEIITFPVSYCEGYLLPRKYNLITQSFLGWLRDKLKSNLIGLIIVFPFASLVYWSLNYCADLWWIISGAVLIGISLLIARLTPTLLISIFFKLKPLEDMELIKRLEYLAGRLDCKINGVFVIDFSTRGNMANAMLGGIGKTRRIILTDTLLKQYTNEEIEIILAHELAHHKLRHVRQLILLQVVVVFFIFYIIHICLYYFRDILNFSSLGDIANLPFIILVAIFSGIIIIPLLNMYSRRLEASADYLALQVTANPGAFISCMTKLTDQNLAVAEPKRIVELILYDHPSYSSRVKMALEYIKNTGSGG